MVPSGSSDFGIGTKLTACPNPITTSLSVCPQGKRFGLLPVFRTDGKVDGVTIVITPFQHGEIIKREAGLHLRIS
jgi:hypothetical protein